MLVDLEIRTRFQLTRASAQPRRSVEMLACSLPWVSCLIALFLALTLVPSVAHAQFTNGDFSGGATGWTAIVPADGSVSYAGDRLTVVGTDNSDGINEVTLSQQTVITGTTLTFDLISYTTADTDPHDFDYPVLIIDGALFALNADGTVSPTAGGTGQGGTALPGSANISYTVTLTPGSHTIGFGVLSTDTQLGAATAIFDNVVTTPISSITLRKTVIGNGATFAFTNTGTGVTNIDLSPANNSSAQQVFNNLTAGTFTLTEEALAGFELTSLTCTGDTDGGNVIDLALRRVTIDLDALEDQVCTFTNTNRITTTTITSDTPDPSIIGQIYAVAVTVTSSGGVPTGSVTISDDVGNSCVATLSAGSGTCNLPSTEAGARNLTASYPATEGFLASTSSGVPHTINQGATTTTVVSSTPNPSVFSLDYTVTASVAATAPAVGTPTGTFTISDGTNSCVTPAIAGGTASCVIPGGAPVGSVTVTATYSGDTSFAGSLATAPHTISTSSDMRPDLTGLPVVAEVGVAYTGTVLCTNDGPGTAQNATCVIAGLPAGISVGTCTPTPPASVTNGFSIACSISGTATTAGATLAVASTGADNDINGGTGITGNNEASKTITTYQSSVETTKIAALDQSLGLNNSVTDAGDKINYTISVRNTGDSPLTNVMVVDTLTRIGGGTLSLDAPPTPASIATLLPGATATFTAEYTLVQADIDAGGVSNSATANATPPAGPEVSDVVDAPVVTTVAPSPALSITKNADDNNLRAAGETIVYTYIVTNTGNVTINNVLVNDNHFGTGTLPVPGNETINTNVTGQSTDDTPNDGVWSVLKPGDSVRFTASYVVTQTDVDTLQ